MNGRSPHVGPLLQAARRPRLAIPSAVALGPLAPAASASYPKLLLDKGQKPHEPRSLDGGFDGALLLGGEAALSAAHDAAMRINELLQEVDIFVIDMLNIILSQNIVGHTRTEYHPDLYHLSGNRYHSLRLKKCPRVVSGHRHPALR